MIEKLYLKWSIDNCIQRECDKANLIVKLQKFTFICIVKRVIDLYKSYRISGSKILRDVTEEHGGFEWNSWAKLPINH